MPTSGADTSILQPNPRAGGQPVPPLIMPGQSPQPAPGGNPSNNNQGQNTITIEDDVTVSGPSAGLNGTPQPSGPSPGGNAQPTTPGTDYNGAVVGMAPGAVAPEQNQPSGNANGWQSSGSDWYYIDPVTNSMVKGWQDINGFWYYFDPGTGIMARGWLKYKEKWYYLFPFAGHDDGKMLTGWRNINDEWYFLETDKGDGQMIIGWKLDNNVWYYLFPDGVMAHDGWVYINEKWYYFNSSGAMQADAIIDYNGKKYYVDKNGVMLTRDDVETVVCKGVTYEVDWDGICTAISAERPVDGDQAAWKAFIESTPEISETRRKILLAGFAALERNCYYHQLRKNYKKPHEKCTSGCDKAIHPLQGERVYDYDTMAAYNADEPFYLDCSYFVKHCYWKAGIEMNSADTGGFYNSSQWRTISKGELRPADIAVERHITGYENGEAQYAGHIIMFLGLTQGSNETVWIEMANHADDGRVSAYNPTARRSEYKYRKWIKSSLD